MKIEYTEGCTCYGLSIDNKDIKEYSIDDKKKIALTLIEKLYNEDDYESLLIDICQTHGEYSFLYQCEQCGDTVCTYTIEYENK